MHVPNNPLSSNTIPLFSFVNRWRMRCYFVLCGLALACLALLPIARGADLGAGNTADGDGALSSNINGHDNTAVGGGALVNSTGNNNTALGSVAGISVTTANNVICIGTTGANASNSCFIGNIRGAVVSPDAEPVLIDSANKLGTTSGSSKRFKEDINTMNSASEAILTLRPVTFHYKADARRTRQFGLIAEEVAQIDPDLVVCDQSGEIYDAVNAMLLNEFLKEHKTVQELESRAVKQDSTIAELRSRVAKQEATIAQQQKGMEFFTAQLKGQAAQIQKVSAEIDVIKAAPQVVLNRQQGDGEGLGNHR